MKKRDYTGRNVESLWNFLESVAEEYPNQPYASQLMKKFLQLSPEDDFNPARELRAVKEGDPSYRTFLRDLLSLRDQTFGVPA